MTSETENTDNTDNTIDSTARPFGYWLRAVDRLLAQEFRTAFAAEGASRGDWRVLNLIDGDVVAPELTARLERGGGRRLRHLADRGWIVREESGWTLTDAGRAAKERLGAIVDGIRAKISATVPEQDLATTMASLEAIARGLGWEEGMRMPRGRERGGRGGRGRGFGRADGRGRGFGPRGFDREGFDPRPGREGSGPRFDREGFGPRGLGREGFGPRFDREGFGPRGFGRGRGSYGADRPGRPDRGGRGGGEGRAAERAYERGFDAGFARGREA